jgi:hypothetical protein
MFQEAVNWKSKGILEELKPRISDKLETDVTSNKNIWFNLMIERVTHRLEA